MPKTKWMDNIPLKIASLMIGFLIWLVVINIDNPTESKTFTLSGDSVELVNTAYIDSFDKMCMQDDTPAPVRITVTAERKILSRLSTFNIQVYADMQQAVSLSTDPVMVPITAVCSGVSAQNIRVSPQFLGIRLEDKATQEFVVNVSYGDSKPAKGYEVGTQTVSPEKVKVTGPKSLVGKIDRVSAVVNVSGRMRDMTDEVSLVVVDKNQDILSDGRMAYLTIDNGGKASVTTKLWRIQSGVRLEAEVNGEPAEGFHVENVAVLPDTISLAGTTQALEELHAYGDRILIDSEELDISGKKEDEEFKVGLYEFLPEGVKLTSGTSEDVFVDVEILPEGSHSYFLPTGAVYSNGLTEGLQASFDSDAIRVRVKAEKGYEIRSFDIAKVDANVYLAGLEAGTYTVPVEIRLPEGYSLLEQVEAEVQIQEIAVLEEAEG